MTKPDRYDVDADAVDWASLLEAMAEAESFATMLGPLLASGALVTTYLRGIDPKTVDREELEERLAVADLDTARKWLTWFVRSDQFVAGNGERVYWNGELDLVFDAVGAAVGYPYPLPPAKYVLPRRIRPCPSCSDTEHVQYRIAGMPAAPPPGFDESRVIYEGCVVDEIALGGDWYCPACDRYYRHIKPSLWTSGYAGVATDEVVADRRNGLTVEELGQLYRDIVLDVPTKVVLDTDTKRRAFLRAQQEVAEIHARGHMVEIPD